MKTVIRLKEVQELNLNPGTVLMWDPTDTTQVITVGPGTTILDPLEVVTSGTYIAQPYTAWQEVRVNINPYGQITTWTGEKVFDSYSSANELNWVNRAGALLWKRDSDNKLVADNAETTQYWNPKASQVTVPTKTGHTLLGVNVGLGKWAVYDYAGLTIDTTTWATANDPVSSTSITAATHGSGWDATNAVLEAYANASFEPGTTTIWHYIKQLRQTNPYVFLASKGEILELIDNACDNPGGHTGNHTYDKNLGSLLHLAGATASDENTRVSSSQDGASKNNAFCVAMNNGRLTANTKTTKNGKSIAMFRFGVTV